MIRSVLLALAFLGSTAAAADWPQWMGPNRDGVLTESVEGFAPKLKWKAPVKGGYSGPAVAGGRVFVLDYDKSAGDDTASPVKKNQLAGKERVLCFDASTGTEVWKREYNCPYELSYPAGPRCTPTVSDGKVYALGAMGDLHCLSASDGSVVWKKDFRTDYEAAVPIWGFSGHPLVVGNRLVCLVGGKDALVVAFDKDTGKEAWKAGGTPAAADGPGYGPPTLIDAGGTKQLVVWHAQAVLSLDPNTGRKLWEEPLKPNYGMAIMAPQASDGVLFAGGIGGVAAAYTLDPSRPAAEVKWKGGKNTGVYPANSTPLIHKGVIYGADVSGHLRAVELATGKRLWETTEPTVGAADKPLNHGTAFLTRAGERFLLFNETGTLILANLTPAGYEPLASAKLLEPTGAAFGRKVVWSAPAYADGCVFARNDKELVCYTLTK